MSGDRHFLDTNVLVYSFDLLDRRKADIAERLVTRALTSGLGVISYQVVQEFVNVGLKQFANPMTVAEVERYFFRVLLPLMKISSSAPLFLQALQLQSSSKLAWYDSLIIASALEGSCKVLYSEDLQHGQHFGDLVIENPFR
ncbi:MAG TPA: PIN domain-containing protein [Terriglobales bacterium]|jgi:predicted nucleic acid-binding protein|nr:PIN domain-containing protein [Terriglobales bacterium]